MSRSMKRGRDLQRSASHVSEASNPLAQDAIAAKSDEVDDTR